MLALLGGLAGLALARGAVAALIALNPPNVPRLAQVSVDGRALWPTHRAARRAGQVDGDRRRRRRTREIGIRMSLGAEAKHVVRMIVRQGLSLIGAGVVVGLCAARLLTGVLTDLLFGVKPSDPATFALIAAALAGAALVACWIPARRAARVDPLVALRRE